MGAAVALEGALTRELGSAAMGAAVADSVARGHEREEAEGEGGAEVEGGPAQQAKLQPVGVEEN